MKKTIFLIIATGISFTACNTAEYISDCPQFKNRTVLRKHNFHSSYKKEKTSNSANRFFIVKKAPPENKNHKKNISITIDNTDNGILTASVGQQIISSTIGEYSFPSVNKNKYQNILKDPTLPPKMTDTRVTHWGAITGMILGILSIFVAGIILGTLAIIFSIIALSASAKYPGMYKGNGMAIAGLICGIIGLLIYLLYLYLILTFF